LDQNAWSHPRHPPCFSIYSNGIIASADTTTLLLAGHKDAVNKRTYYNPSFLAEAPL
jgi:hypothetical protein